jgi:mono/diheme cytochrome c family protein
LSSRRRRHLPAHALFAMALLLATGSVGCWEQWSESWWPQMKWQAAVQGWSSVKYDGREDPYLPVAGTYALNQEPPVLPQYSPAVDQIKNPTDATDFHNLEKGKQLFDTYCIVCHGPRGLGDGPVSAAGTIQGPFAGVFPVVTAAGRSDGYIYNLIRGGGQRMPSYQRIEPQDRWAIVDFVRYLQKGGQP